MGVILQAHNRRELIEKVEKKTFFDEVIVIDRKFIRFDSLGYLYQYRIQVIKQKLMRCSNCSNKISEKHLCWVNKKPVCSTCYNKLRLVF